MIKKIKDILKNNIEKIYCIGVFDSEDKEFIISNNYLILELQDEFIELEAIDGYGRLKITITKTISEKIFLNDVTEGKVSIESIVFTNPLSSVHKVKNITFYNLKIEPTTLFSDVLRIELDDGQIIFIDPGFLGITLGEETQKDYWYENLDEEYKNRINILNLNFNDHSMT